MDARTIVDAALAVLDETGLPDLSMRRIGAALQVQPSALYWHVRSKQELLGLVADRIVAEAPRRATLGEQVAELESALLAHRDGAELVASAIALGTGGAGVRSLIAQARASEGHLADDRVTEAVALMLLGHSQLRQQREQATAIGVELGPATPPSTTLHELVALIAGDGGEGL